MAALAVFVLFFFCMVFCLSVKMVYNLLGAGFLLSARFLGIVFVSLSPKLFIARALLSFLF